MDDIEIIYSEPSDYFPEEIRKSLKLGEYAEDVEDEDELVKAKPESETDVAGSTSETTE